MVDKPENTSDRDRGNPPSASEAQGAPQNQHDTTRGHIDTATFMQQLEAKSDEEWLDALHMTEEEHHVEAMETAAVARFGHIWKKLYTERHPHQTRYAVDDEPIESERADPAQKTDPDL